MRRRQARRWSRTPSCAAWMCEKARALPGVAAVLTAADIPGEHNHGLVIYDWPALVGVGERVRYVGDAIAIVAAETREIATEALDLIEVEVRARSRSSATRCRPASRTAPQLHANGNLLKHIKVRKGDMEQGFAEADVILEHTFHTAITDHAFMEPECSIARADRRTGAWRSTSARRSPIPTAARWRARWAGRRNACTSSGS